MEITDITGITNEMVANHRIAAATVEAFIDSSVVICFAHNRYFDRKSVERYLPIFAQKAWRCSAREVEWSRFNFAGANLA